MLVHLALATALFLAGTHLAPPLLDSHTGTVILAAPDPDANVRAPGHCPPAGGEPRYRDLSGRALIPATPRTAPASPGPHP